MAVARAWVVAITGLFGIWLVYTILGQFIGFTWGLYRYLNASFAEAGVPIPQDWDQDMGKLYNTFLLFWNYAPPILFISVMIYVILESMRRRPEEYGW